MSNTHYQLTRKCSICGIVKPLALFLQPAKTYGIICHPCQEKIDRESEGSGGRKKTHRIDNEAKNFLETEDKKLSQKIKELYEEELEKKDHLAQEKEDKKVTQASIERKHRETYLEETQKNSLQDKERTLIDEAEAHHESDRKFSEETQQRQDSMERDTRINTKFDFNVPFLDSLFARVELNSPRFLELKKRWGASAMMNTLDQTRNPLNQPEGAKSTSQTPSLQDSKSPTESLTEKKSGAAESAKPEPPKVETQKPEPTKPNIDNKPRTDLFSRSLPFYQPLPQKTAQGDPAPQKTFVEDLKQVWGPSKKR